MPELFQSMPVHQSVHGYKNGHRLLVASCPLSLDAEATMLTMSDVLFSELSEASDSYLTGYPLKQENMYVLARTWAAPESPRRGSVWTHSLLLDYSTLTRIEDVFVLLKLFQRPSVDSLSTYELPKHLSSSEGSDYLQRKDVLATDERLMGVLAQLYGPLAKNKVRTFSKDDSSDEAIALGLWRQMWPSLRRSFSFSTRASSEDLGLGDVRLTFDLDDYSIAHTRAGGLDSVDIRGLNYLAVDLPKRGPTRLRRFLGRYAYDAANPRLIVPSLASVFAERRDPVDALSSYESLLGETPGLLRLKHALLLASARDTTNPSSFVKAMGMFAKEPAGTNVAALVEQVRNITHIETSGALIRAVSSAPQDSIGSELLPVLMEVLPLEVLASEVPSRLKPQLLELRRGVARQSSFWPEAKDTRRRLLAKAIELGVPVSDLLQGLRSQMTGEDARALIEYDEASLMPLYEVALSTNDDELLDLLSGNANFLSLIVSSRAEVTIENLERFASLAILKEPVTWCSPSETATLISRSGRRPASTQPNLATLAFVGAASSKGQESGWLFESVFDAVFDLVDRFAMPRACERLLLGVPGLVGSTWLPDRVLEVVLLRYSVGRRILPQLFGVSANPYALSKLARQAIKILGEDEVRRAHAELSGVKNLQLPRAVVSKAIESAMPFFSKPLQKK